MGVIYNEKLLTRDEFREQTFARDNHKCVVCGEAAVDAHHILERRLWGKTQGYYLSNGASVCEVHHLECERTNISVEQIRELCGIEQYSIPEHFYSDVIYDKWGNIVLEDGKRTKGELFYDESVQKIIKDSLPLFTHYVKYPRTYHLPWSEGLNKDDRTLQSMDNYIGKRVIVTEKMDGENTSMYSDYYHARSIDGRNHPSRSWAKNFHSTICYNIPEGWRVCCENVYAEHSIHYDNLDTFVYGFSIWDENNNCLSWDETKVWFELLGITSVPVLYDGIYDEIKIKKLWDSKNWNTREGYVLRLADKFSYGEFRNSVAKFVRKNHVQTAKHWMFGQPIIKNELKKGE